LFGKRNKHNLIIEKKKAKRVLLIKYDTFGIEILKTLEKINFMKRNLIFASLIAVATMFTSCQQSGTQTANVAANDSTTVVSNIAVINIDSVLVTYKLAEELNAAISKKYANMQSKLEQEGARFQKEAEAFQDKLQKGVFLSQQRAEEEQQRLIKKQEELQRLEASYSQQLNAEQAQMNQTLYEKISAYINKYNTPEKYQFILNKATLWYSNNAFDITADVIKGLNEEYDASK